MRHSIVCVVAVASLFAQQISEGDKAVFLRMSALLSAAQSRASDLQNKLGIETTAITQLSSTLADLRAGLVKTCASAGKKFVESPTLGCR